MIEVQKNSLERFRIQVSEYRGHKFIDLRVYFQTDDGMVHPSKKGVTMNLDTVDEVISALQAAKAELEAGK